MKQAILLHGTGGSSKDYFWFSDTKKYLDSLGYSIWWPYLPSADSPLLKETLEFVKANIPSTSSETIIIGHSSACPLILSLLQRDYAKAGLAVLVSGYYAAIGNVVSDRMIEKDGYNWKAINNNSQKIVLINSDNDPWGCDDKQAKPVADKLGADFIIAEGQGHMGSEKFNQPYRENHYVKDIIKEYLNA